MGAIALQEEANARVATMLSKRVSAPVGFVIVSPTHWHFYGGH